MFRPRFAAEVRASFAKSDSQRGFPKGIQCPFNALPAARPL
jgi:hypothetical protein